MRREPFTERWNGTKEKVARHTSKGLWGDQQTQRWGKGTLEEHRTGEYSPQGREQGATHHLGRERGRDESASIE